MIIPSAQAAKLRDELRAMNGDQLARARRIVQIADCAEGGHAPSHAIREVGEPTAVEAYCACAEVRWIPASRTEDASTSTSEIARLRYGMKQLRELSDAYRGDADSRIRDVGIVLDVIESYATGAVQ